MMGTYAPEYMVFVYCLHSTLVHVTKTIHGCITDPVLYALAIISCMHKWWIRGNFFMGRVPGKEAKLV